MGDGVGDRENRDFSLGPSMTKTINCLLISILYFFLNNIIQVLLRLTMCPVQKQHLPAPCGVLISMRQTSDLCDVTGNCWAELTGNFPGRVSFFKGIQAFIRGFAISTVLKLRCEDDSGTATIS